MKIKITHSTTYKYTSTVPRLIQCLKLYPSICDNQEILEWETSSSSGRIVESHIDGLGHRVQNIFVNNFSGQHRITSKGILKTKDLSGVVRGLKEKVNPLCFLRETHLTQPCKRIEKISNDHIYNFHASKIPTKIKRYRKSNKKTEKFLEGLK